MDFLEKLKAQIPDYAKDVRLNLDAILLRSSLQQEEAMGCALAAAFSSRSAPLILIFRTEAGMSPAAVDGCHTAASLMGMTNSWYSYIDLAGDADLKAMPPQLRMNGYANHGGVSERQFEMWGLAASIVGKCKYCIAAHVTKLKELGLSAAELRDIGRIAAVINALSQIIVAEAK